MWKKRKSSTTFTFNGEKVFLAASQTLGTIFSYFQTSRIGLTQEEVEARQSLYGKNEVEHEQKKNPISTFIKAFINPFIAYSRRWSSFLLYSTVLWPTQVNRTGQPL